MTFFFGEISSFDWGRAWASKILTAEESDSDPSFGESFDQSSEEPSADSFNRSEPFDRPDQKEGVGKSDGIRSAASPDDQIRASAQLTPASPRLCDELTLTVTTAHPADWSAAAPEFSDRYGHFIIEKSENLPPVIHDGIETSTFRLTLIPTESGDVPLLPIPLTFQPIGKSRHGGPAPETVSLLIPGGTATIQSERDPSDVSLAEMTGPQHPMTDRTWLYLLAGAGLAAAAIAFALCRRRGAKKRTVIEMTPSERALMSLSDLMASAIHKTDVRQFYLTLTGIVRRFIEETTGIRAPEQTTEEFLRAAEIDSESNFNVELRRDLADFLEFSDLVKFAKFHPTEEEIASGYERARQVVLHDYRKGTEKDALGETETKS